MTYEKLYNILISFFSEEEINHLWKNPSLNIQYSEYKKFLAFNPLDFGYTFCRGQISASSVRFEFQKENYELTVTVHWDFFLRRRYNYALLHPHFIQEHYVGRKRGIAMSSVKIMNDKDFKSYQKKIEKRFPFPIKNQAAENDVKE